MDGTNSAPEITNFDGLEYKYHRVVMNLNRNLKRTEGISAIMIKHEIENKCVYWLEYLLNYLLIILQ